MKDKNDFQKIFDLLLTVADLEALMRSLIIQSGGYWLITVKKYFLKFIFSVSQLLT